MNTDTQIQYLRQYIFLEDQEDDGSVPDVAIDFAEPYVAQALLNLQDRGTIDLGLDTSSPTLVAEMLFDNITADILTSGDGGSDETMFTQVFNEAKHLVESGWKPPADLEEQLREILTNRTRKHQ